MSGKRRPNLLPPINHSAKNPSPCIGVDDKGNNNSNKRTVLPMTFDLFATAVRANTLPTALHKGAGMVHPPSGCVGCSHGFRCKIILYPMMTIIIKFSISNIDRANRFHTYSAGRLEQMGNGWREARTFGVKQRWQLSEEWSGPSYMACWMKQFFRGVLGRILTEILQLQPKLQCLKS